MSDSSTRGSRDASLENAMSQNSSESITKEVSESNESVEKLRPAKVDSCEKKALFSLFNSKLLLSSEEGYSSTNESITKPQKLDDLPQKSSESLEINDDEIQQILGKDLADLIFVNKSSDSVS